MNRVEDAILKFPGVVDRVESARTLPERLGAFAALGSIRRLFEDGVKWLKAEEERIGEPLIEDMAADGMTSVNVDVDGTRFNIHTKRDFFCSKRSDEDGSTQAAVCDALKGLGLTDLCGETYNAASVKSRVKEWLANGVEVPPVLAQHLRWGETVKLVSTK